jgi:predicted MFS family arabinose efflux permease
MADVTDREGRTSGMALIGAAFGLGIIFGPAIGALLSYVSLLAPVYFSVAVALLNAIFVSFRLPEPERHVHAEPSQGTGELAKRVWPLLGVAVVATVASVAMEQTIAFYFQDRLSLSEGETARTVGGALVVYGVVAVFVQGYLVRRTALPPVTLLRIGLPIGLLGLVLLVFAAQLGPLIFALALQGFGQGLALPGVTAALSLSVGESDQGTVAGLNSSAQGLGRTLGPLLGTSLYELEPELPYVSSAALVFLVLVFVLASPRMRAFAGAVMVTKSNA